MQMKKMKRSVLSIAMAAVTTAGFAGTTFYVSPDATGAGDEDFSEEHPGTLQNAIAEATARSSWEDGDEIVLLPSAGSTKGVYSCAGLTPDETRYAYFFCDKAYLKIRGYSGNRDDIELQGKGDEDYRCFRVKAQTSFSGLSFRDFVIPLYLPKGGSGKASVAGGENIAADGSHITSGGGAICSQSDNWGGVASVVSNCAFYACQAGYGGAVQGCTVMNSLFQSCLFSGAYGSVGGGGAAKSTCLNCVFDSCASAADTLYNARGGGTMNCINSNCLFMSCRAYMGAATATSAAWTSTGGENVFCVFTNNTVVDSGSGVCVCGQSKQCIFVDNRGVGLIYGLTRACLTDRCLFVRNETSMGLVSSDCYNSLIVNNVCRGKGGGRALCVNGRFFNCTIVSNEVDAAVFGGATKGIAYNCLIAENAVGYGYVGQGLEAELYNCTADIRSHENSVVRAFSQDDNLKNGIRRGVDPMWKVPDMPIGIKVRDSITGRGSNLMSDETTPIWASADVDYAGQPRLREGGVVDIGCHARVPGGYLLRLR